MAGTRTAGNTKAAGRHVSKARVLGALAAVALSAAVAITASSAFFAPESDRFLLALPPMGIACFLAAALAVDFLQKPRN